MVAPGASNKIAVLTTVAEVRWTTAFISEWPPIWAITVIATINNQSRARISQQGDGQAQAQQQQGNRRHGVDRRRVRTKVGGRAQPLPEGDVDGGQHGGDERQSHADPGISVESSLNPVSSSTPTTLTAIPVHTSRPA